jgi:predicted MFS family arabinose efflux permease
VAAPGVQGTFGLSYGTAALVLLVLPQLLSFVIEPPLFVLADRLPRKPLVVGGLLALGLSLIAAGLAPGVVAFATALALASPASGVGVNLAQATLVDAHPDQRESVLTRWALMGSLGDLAAPALVAGLAAASLGWREAFAITGLLVALYAVALLPFRFPAAVGAGGEGAHASELPLPLRETLRGALGNRALVGWLLGVSLCGMLDEVLVAFAALHLERTLGASVAERSLVLGAFTAGGLCGLLASERLLRRVPPLRLLRGSSALCAGCYLAWLTSTSVVANGVLLAGVGCFAAPLYPIAKAQAYRALPGSSALVVAGAQLLAPLELAVPLALGLAADAVGLPLALSLLLLQPLGMLALAAYLGRRDPRGEKTGSATLALPIAHR